MQRKTVSGIMVTLIMFGTLAFALHVRPAKAVFVGSITIQAGGSIDPPDAPVLNVGNVFYNFTDSISGSVVVRRNDIVIDGAGNTVQGTGALFSIGIDLSGIRNVTIKNMKIRGWAVGVSLDGSGVLLAGNDIGGNSGSDIDIRNLSHHNTIVGNNIYGYGSNYGVYAGPSSSYITIAKNNIDGNNYGISFLRCGNYEIIGNNITRNSNYGIWVRNSSNNNMTGNNIELNKIGGIMAGGSYNTFVGNHVAGNYGDGVTVVGGSSYNTLFGNLVTGNQGHGVWLGGSNNSITGNNIVSNFGEGIRLEGSSYTNLIRNNLTGNRYFGIGVYASNFINVVGNRETGGSNIWYGIELSQSSNNSIHHNNFIWNQYTESKVSCDNLPNAWDDGYPSGGNYWSDYVGADLKSDLNQDKPGSDGIGDATYIVDANNTDHYPLMAPSNTFDAGTWNGVSYNIDVVSKSTVSNFAFNQNEKLIGFTVSGSDGTVGFCRVMIANSLLRGPYVIMINDSPPLTSKEMSNGTRTFLYFTYNHSTKTVQIIGTTVVPEFTSAIVLPLFMVLTMFALIFTMRRIRKPTT